VEEHFSTIGDLCGRGNGLDETKGILTRCRPEIQRKQSVGGRDGPRRGAVTPHIRDPPGFEHQPEPSHRRRATLP
jgi:hypothetical protein